MRTVIYVRTREDAQIVKSINKRNNRSSGTPINLLYTKYTEDVNGLTGSRVPVHLCTRRLVLELLKVAGCGLHYEERYTKCVHCVLYEYGGAHGEHSWWRHLLK